MSQLKRPVFMEGGLKKLPAVFHCPPECSWVVSQHALHLAKLLMLVVMSPSGAVLCRYYVNVAHQFSE